MAKAKFNPRRTRAVPRIGVISTLSPRMLERKLFVTAVSLPASNEGALPDRLRGSTEFPAGANPVGVLFCAVPASQTLLALHLQFRFRSCND